MDRFLAPCATRGNRVSLKMSLLHRSRSPATCRRLDGGSVCVSVFAHVFVTHLKNILQERRRFATRILSSERCGTCSRVELLPPALALVGDWAAGVRPTRRRARWLPLFRGRWQKPRGRGSEAGGLIARSAASQRVGICFPRPPSPSGWGGWDQIGCVTVHRAH